VNLNVGSDSDGLRPPPAVPLPNRRRTLFKVLRRGPDAGEFVNVSVGINPSFFHMVDITAFNRRVPGRPSSKIVLRPIPTASNDRWFIK